MGRSIPAWAGEPDLHLDTLYWHRVYPRVGGGTDNHGWALIYVQGLSPRGRGNLGAQLPVGLGDGSIPAWAGEPDEHGTRWACRRVYPRVGGGTLERAG